MVLESALGRDCCKKKVVKFFTKMFWLGCLSTFKRFDAFSVIRLKGKAGFLIEKFLGVFCFPRALVVDGKSFEKGFLSSFISKYVFSAIGN